MSTFLLSILLIILFPLFIFIIDCILSIFLL